MFYCSLSRLKVNFISMETYHRVCPNDFLPNCEMDDTATKERLEAMFKSGTKVMLL